MPAGYDRMVCIGKVFEIDDSDAKISFYEHAGTLSIGSIFCEPKKRDKIWVDFVNILCAVPVSAETKQGKKLKFARKCDRKLFCMEKYKLMLDIHSDFETETNIMQ